MNKMNWRLTTSLKAISSLFLLLTFILPIMPGTSCIAAPKPISLMAAAYKTVITPKNPAGLFIAGYSPRRLSTGAHDELSARCLLLSDGKTKVALVSLDLIGLMYPEIEKVRQKVKIKGLPKQNIIICSTHTHSGPDTIGLWGPNQTTSGVNKEYMDFLSNQIALCINRAAQILQPAYIELAQGTVPRGVSKNAREPDLLDLQITVMRVRNAKTKETIATLVNFANHPEVLTSESKLLSSDWCHYLYEKLDKELGGITLFFNGALGGMITPDVKAHTFEEAERVGLATAEATLQALQQGVEVCREVKISLKTAKVQIPLGNPGFLALLKTGVLQRELYNGNLLTELAAFKIGKAGFVTIPGEALPAIGLDLKKAMPTKYKFIFGLGNDELGYILYSKDYYNDKLYSYERSMSVGSQAAPIIVSKLKELLKQLR